MIKSIHFAVKKWQYNSNAKLISPRTDSNVAVHPLRKHQNPNGKAEGLCFLWYLIITANGIEVLYYSSEEFFIIPNREISDTQLLHIVRQSFERTSYEVAMKNLKVGLDAGFPIFEKQLIDLKVIRGVLDM